jgi:catechol 2,3-dioxygenase-like lactoylglutathione lyase family enzyme
MAAIRHIEFWVSNLKRSLDFYKSLFAALGWTHIDDNGFALEGIRIYFLQMHGASPAPKTFGPRHICFTAQSKEAVDAIAQLPILSKRILHGPAELHTSGSYMLVFKDPDGYLLEVACNTKS